MISDETAKQLLDDLSKTTGYSIGTGRTSSAMIRKGEKPDPKPDTRRLLAEPRLPVPDRDVPADRMERFPSTVRIMADEVLPVPDPKKATQ